ncbi:MAG: hypothetical protein IPI67_26605 [Myxococcales bacterium]|nr:hypothetical protein [Myxococcales bacterium]
MCLENAVAEGPSLGPVVRIGAADFVVRELDGNGAVKNFGLELDWRVQDDLEGGVTRHDLELADNFQRGTAVQPYIGAAANASGIKEVDRASIVREEPLLEAGALVDALLEAEAERGAEDGDLVEEVGVAELLAPTAALRTPSTAVSSLRTRSMRKRERVLRFG